MSYYVTYVRTGSERNVERRAPFWTLSVYHFPQRPRTHRLFIDVFAPPFRFPVPLRYNSTQPCSHDHPSSHKITPFPSFFRTKILQVTSLGVSTTCGRARPSPCDRSMSPGTIIFFVTRRDMSCEIASRTAEGLSGLRRSSRCHHHQHRCAPASPD